PPGRPAHHRHRRPRIPPRHRGGLTTEEEVASGGWRVASEDGVASGSKGRETTPHAHIVSYGWPLPRPEQTRAAEASSGSERSLRPRAFPPPLPAGTIVATRSSPAPPTTCPPAANWLRSRSRSSAFCDSTPCEEARCVDSKLASFGAFCSVLTPQSRLCFMPSPWHTPSPASVPTWVKIPTSSFVESSDETGFWIGDSGFWVGDFSSPPAIWHSSFAIWHSWSAARHAPSAIPAFPFRVPNSAFRILRSVSSVRSSSRVLADWYRRCRSNAGLQSSPARAAQSGSPAASLASFLASSSLSRPTCRSTTP